MSQLETTGATKGDAETADTPGEATVLVSEFPPPPSYYEQYFGADAATTLSPPEIPVERLRTGTKRAAEEAARVMAESERMRLGEEIIDTDAILGGVSSSKDAKDEDVVAVFGEVVEDPFEFKPLDECDEPTVVRDEIKRLNQEILHDFVKLVGDLVDRPGQNKKTRDELSHKMFLMTQEINKYREHQARETMIELLESQLEERQKLIAEVNALTEEAEDLLGST